MIACLGLGRQSDCRLDCDKVVRQGCAGRKSFADGRILAEILCLLGGAPNTLMLR